METRNTAHSSRSEWRNLVPIKATKTGKPVTECRTQGYKWYTVIVGASFINPIYFEPQTIKKDARGRPLPSKFGGSNAYQTQPLNPSGGSHPNVDNKVVNNWKTASSDLQLLGGPERQLVNAVKKWINQTDSAVWFHDGNSDLCSLFGGPHLHVVVKSIERMDGSYSVLQYGGDYKNIVKFCDQLRQHEGSGDCYIKSQRVRLLPNLIKYLGTPPRIFLGTRSVELGTLRRQISADSNANDGPVTDVGCDDDELDEGGADDGGSAFDDDDFGKVCVASKRPGGEVEVPSASKQIRRTESQSTIGSEPGDRDVPPADFSRDVVQLKADSNQDRLANLIERLMIYLGEYDYESIIIAIGQLDSLDVTNRQVKALWNKLVCRAGTQPIIKRVRDRLKATNQTYKLEQLCENFLDSRKANNDNYLSITESLDMFNELCERNGLDFDEVCYTVYAIMDRIYTKVNTMLVMGPSNAGKSMFFKNTLCPLTPFNAQVGSVGNSGQFLWQMCPGARAIYIEECRMAPEHIETAKLIFGGEDAMIDVKCQPQARLARTPVFISSNSYPWLQAPSPHDKQALINRMVIYHVTTWPELADVDKQLHPGMWWSIVQAIKQNEATKTRMADPFLEEGFREMRNPIDVDQCKSFSYMSTMEFDCKCID